MNPAIDLTVHDDTAAVLAQLTRVVVPTDDGDDGLDRVRRAATQLADEHGWELVLYDRSQETWLDHPHPSGPMTAEQISDDDLDHLREQLGKIEAAGVSATTWVATVPSLSAMIDALQGLDVDGVLLPSQLGEPSLLDRLLVGGDPADTIERVADLQLPADAPTFLVLDDDGTLRVDRR